MGTGTCFFVLPFQLIYFEFLACAALPFSELYIRFGAKWPFFFAGLLSVLATAMMPLMAELNFYALLAARFVQGISYGKICYMNVVYGMEFNGVCFSC